MHAVADAHEFALDDTLLRFAAGREQNLVVALQKLLLGSRDRLHRHVQNVVERLAERLQHVMCRAAREIEHGHREDGQDND